ncbi:MAG: C4-dicarboxylate ABC transporter [Piscirickettsiaceae bacterium CG_4_9_14_3_um_filter_43_564]|nr:TRAP transporter large permease subunit [Thiomicrospira sp.]OIP94096.1 MAG: C4-dicarboxylate ABC transporter [Thiomicrospira sp. CG2_30_44_34]PIQ03002.1 MAG: C4-dicarboxylate ABC transporter [Piscirickettsiaceae bacterium CG18_big_fil_WC_8_21_14_2_50_44_103]PIU38644.1 MAG: C4-dicarboxylate ABC transporter [Piscirickettsiaceae bacterium CG07_land_8_20_14_0_80_44_28]PIW57090.1 MAG: C4-dicarboxylate ABC transporter [Piscirickettsiaceae bacterium CG12_big_fil_rev_8_21_14_0_65_44_934]PIW76766.1 
MEWLALLLFAMVFIALMIGFPVALTLAGMSLLFALASDQFGWFDMAFLNSIPNRLFSIMTNPTLMAVPLFVFMGILLEKSKLAEQLLTTLDEVMRGFRGGLGFSVILVGTLLAASTGIVGATVVTMGLLALPTMLKQGYCPKLATGTICAAGTLGQIIPPSIILILLGDVLSSAYQQAQLNQGIFSPETLSVGDLFIGALFPGMLLVVGYMTYVFAMALFKPETVPAANNIASTPGLLGRILQSLLPPLALILLVLGSILGGFATPTEAASLGALGAIFLAAFRQRLSLTILQEVMQGTLKITSMIFLIFIGAAFFSLTFRGLGGDDLIHQFLTDLPGGVFTAVFLVMLVLFIMGFFLDFIEITYIIVPVVAPVLLMMGVDPIWLGIMIAINLQTAFLTPPFGFALFYLKGVAPNSISTLTIYKGVLPFILIQLFVLILLAIWPQIATWLPAII